MNTEAFDSGAVRDKRIGKGRYDLISPHAIHSLARRLEEGALKYGERNWEKGMPMTRCYDSALRHLHQWMMGETDEDHLTAALCNIHFMIHYAEVCPEMDDRKNKLEEKRK